MSDKASASASPVDENARKSDVRSLRKGRRWRKADRTESAHARERTRPRRPPRARDEAPLSTPAPEPQRPPEPQHGESASLGELDLELTFFESAPPLALSLPPPLPVEEDPEAQPLTPKELERRLRFRRYVLQLMAVLGVFSSVISAIRVASLL